MYRSCSRCGKIHDTSKMCPKVIYYKDTDERKFRSSFAWREKAEQIKKKASYLCEYHKAAGQYVYDNLEVHHIRKARDDKDSRLDNNNLICLCSECHHKADKGQIKAERLIELVQVREGEKDPPVVEAM